MKKHTKKAAMFGLDARIALAIFGALSVVTGAALYSAIQKSKTIKFITQLEEFGKAIDSYRLDTGEELVNNVFSKMGSLVENTDNNPFWKGPYLDLTRLSSSRLSWGDYTVEAQPDGDRINRVPRLSNGVGCTITSVCDMYIRVRYSGSNLANVIKLFESIDEHIDGPSTADTYKNGKVHFVQAGNNTSTLDSSLISVTLMYKYSPVINR